MAAGNRLSALLHGHITIADFLAHANPKSWPDNVMRAHMKTHLDQTLAEAADEMHGHYRASVRDYEAVFDVRLVDVSDFRET